MDIKEFKATKIVIFNKDVPAGVSTILKNIIKFKPKSNLKYKLVLYKYEEKNHNTISEDWCDDVVRFNLSGFDNLYHTLNTIRETVNSESIIVANDITELRMVVLLKLSNPLIYIVHGDFETYYGHCEIFQDYIDKFIVYSKFINDKLNLRLKPANRHKVNLIYYPVPEVKNELVEFKDNILKIVFVGNLIERKGVDLLPSIIEKLEDKDIKYHFNIVGSGELNFWLQEAFQNNKNVTFLGQKNNEEVIEILKRNNVLLFPTRSEGLPNVLVEAMKSGCVPIISSIESGIPEVVSQNKDGILVEVNNVDAFSESLIELYTSPDILEKMKENAIVKANKMFNPEKNAKNYFDAFTQVSVNLNKLNNVPKIPLGPILNKRWIPNRIVQFIRKFNFNPNF
ncbi:glycosyltransferase family 4 protein [Formosa haliotis]|uniref:glycosyltransferase family 4 protein n=1 Tax=Formosa haliotis TaxID=1555194 RepID=UPI000824C0F7|nr:glycosyltransferase family 4 protein [Formosa haliotis]